MALPADERLTITTALDWWLMKCCIKKKAIQVLGRQATGMYGVNAAQGQPANNVDTDYTNFNEEMADAMTHMQQQKVVM